MTTATTGTGTITLGSAVSGYLTFNLAGVANGDVVTYGIKDGANSEIGTGTYTTSGTTLTRAPTKSTNGNAAISLSGTAEVFISPRAEDLNSAFEPNTVTSASASALAVGANGATNPVLKVDASTVSVATGVQIKGAAAASGAALSVISSGANENLTIDAKGTGVITLGGTSTGAVNVLRALVSTAGMVVASGGSNIYDSTFNGSTQIGIVLRSSVSATSTMMVFTTTAGGAGSIQSTNTTTAYNTSSDARLKNDFRPFDAGRIIDALRVGEFDWKLGGRGYGVLAQEAYKIFPEAVSVGDDDLSTADAMPWQVDYSKYVPVLLAELKMLRARVLALENGGS